MVLLNFRKKRPIFLLAPICFLMFIKINVTNATYSTGIKTTRVYQSEPIVTHTYDQHHYTYPEQEQHHHHHDHHHHQHHEHHNNADNYQYTQSNSRLDSPTYSQRSPPSASASTSDNTYQQQQQQQHEGAYYQQQQPLYDRTKSAQTYQQQRQQSSRKWQDSENSITEYYTGCPTGHTGQLPYAYDCRRFLNCWHGRGHIQTCSVGTVFNPETLECDRPDKVKCEAALGQTQTTSSQLKQQASPKYRAGRLTDLKLDSVDILCSPDAQGLQPHPSDCTKFVNCANGNVHIQDCGPGTAFDKVMKVCDFRHKVDCAGRDESDTLNAASSRQGKSLVLCPHAASGLYPHPHDCAKFLQCSNGETYVQDCGPGTGFDRLRLICDYKEKVECGSGRTWTTAEETVSHVTSTATTAVNTQQNHHSPVQHNDLPHTADILCLNDITGLFPYPFDYTKFINCKNGNTAIQNCVPGNAFSLSKGYCEPLDRIQQSDHVMYIVSQVSYEYAQTLITCPPGTEGIHLYPFDGEKYIKCLQSQLEVIHCPATHYFSFSQRSCLPRNQVPKQQRVRLLSELSTTNSYRVTEEQSNLHKMVQCPMSVTGDYPHPFDSTKYLKCSRGRLLSESCTSGNAFSLSRKHCYPKEEVNANDRIPLVQPSSAISGDAWSLNGFEITYGSREHFGVPVLSPQSTVEPGTIRNQTILGLNCTKYPYGVAVPASDGLTYLMCPPGIEGFFLHPFDCTKYIECSSDGTEVDSCLNGSVFSISRKECIPRDKVEAFDRVEYMVTTKNEFSGEREVRPDNEPGITCSPGTFGIYPHPQDSTKYMRCANGRISVENCLQGQVFSVSKSYCQNENEVQANDRSSYSKSTHFVADNSYNTGYANQGHYNPNKAVELPQMLPLQPPLAGPPVAAAASSSYTPTMPPAPTSYDGADIACPSQSNGRYAHPYDCTKFIMCSNGVPHVQNCGPGTAWNKAMEVCDFKEKVDCYQTPTVRQPVDQISCPPGAEGLYEHPYDWHQYLSCTNGITNIMNCGPGTVFSISRKICDYEPNVTNTDRCNNGVYSTDYNYQTHTRESKSFGSGSNAQTWTNQQPNQLPHTPNRWNTMNMNRPQGSQANNWQHTSTNVHYPAVEQPQYSTPSNNDRTPVWSGTAVHKELLSPTQTVLYEEGSLQPNRNYNHQMFSTPLAPLSPPVTGPIPPPAPSPPQPGHTIVYAQPLGSQEDSKEAFNPPKYPVHSNPNQNLYPKANSPAKNHTRQQNYYPMTSNTWTPVIDNRQTFVSYGDVPITSHLMPPHQGPAPPPLHSGYAHTKPYAPPDAGQRPLHESDFHDFDQLPAGSKKINTVDESNLYGGLQPPLKTAQAVTTTTTTARNFYAAEDSNTQIPIPSKGTTPLNRVAEYPPLSEATIQTFPHQPHYSPPYAEVAHSRNTSWSGNSNTFGRKLPQNTTPKSVNVPTYSQSPPAYNRVYYNSEREADDEGALHETDDANLPISEALKVLLRPYMHRGDVNDDMAEKAIMNLLPNSSGPQHTATTTTTTNKPYLHSQNDPRKTTQTPDVELILAGEQHHLTGIHVVQDANRESSTINNLNWHKNHPQYIHDPKTVHQHSLEHHQKHPNLPNPFNNPLAKSSPVSDLCAYDCGNGKCIEQHEVCNGVNNCGNRKDEQECDHLGYEVRLTGGESAHMGRVEVKILGKWSNVCDDKFGLPDADVVCRELGFKMGAMEVRGNSYYPPEGTNVNFAMDEVECKGNETSLRECDFKGWGINNCGPDEVVGVVCKAGKLKCPINYWLCSTSKECIPTAFLCDVTPDCADGSDESPAVCNATISYRLGGGRSAAEGRIEVFYRGEWGTVCDDDFSIKEAQIVCNSLGYYGRSHIVKNVFGPGSGPIWLDQVSCMGNETSLDKCNHWSWGENNCNHTEDVAIKCNTGPKPTTSNRAAAASTTQETVHNSELDSSELDDLEQFQGIWERSSKALNKDRRCGQFKSNLFDEYLHPEERVINGTIAKRGRHPWQATIRTRGRGGISSHWCGAVIISKKLILTAAHCLAGYPKGSYFVRMGDHYANLAESSEIDSNIDNWYIHEKFRDQKHMNNDIALILLKHPVKFNDYIQPVCLPEKGAVLESNRKCTISGWGSIKSGVSTPSNILRAAQVPILADNVCQQKTVYGNAMTEGMFCAGALDESVDACDGDSGGPLVCSDDDGETLYGIISWGQHCGFANRPGVYVRVEKYIDWIYDKIYLIKKQGKL